MDVDIVDETIVAKSANLRKRIRYAKSQYPMHITPFTVYPLPLALAAQRAVPSTNHNHV